MRNFIFVVLVALSTSGCATLVKGSRQDVEVKTAPPGLRARINTQQCITPCVLKNVSRKSAEQIHVEYRGIEKAYDLDKSFNFWSSIAGNVWNEIWPGLIVDAVSGALRDIEPINLVFEESGNSTAVPVRSVATQ